MGLAGFSHLSERLPGARNQARHAGDRLVVDRCKVSAHEQLEPEQRHRVHLISIAASRRQQMSYLLPGVVAGQGSETVVRCAILGRSQDVYRWNLGHLSKANGA